MFVEQNSSFIRETGNLRSLLIIRKLEMDMLPTPKRADNQTFLMSLPEFQIRNKLSVR